MPQKLDKVPNWTESRKVGQSLEKSELQGS